MKKHPISVFLVVTAVFAAFTLGFFLGRNQNSGAITVSVPPAMQTAPTQAVSTSVPETSPTEAAVMFPLDINLASEDAFQALPGIGEVLAQRIVAYREENGPFQALEELMNVEGIGEKRMEQILQFITIGG